MDVATWNPHCCVATRHAPSVDVALVAAVAVRPLLVAAVVSPVWNF